jgi:hypothetical protein
MWRKGHLPFWYYRSDRHLLHSFVNFVMSSLKCWQSFKLSKGCSAVFKPIIGPYPKSADSSPYLHTNIQFSIITGLLRLPHEFVCWDFWTRICMHSSFLPMHWPSLLSWFDFRSNDRQGVQIIMLLVVRFSQVDVCSISLRSLQFIGNFVIVAIVPWSPTELIMKFSTNQLAIQRCRKGARLMKYGEPDQVSWNSVLGYCYMPKKRKENRLAG